MKTWYGVQTVFYDNGRVNAMIVSIKDAEEKPEDTCTSTRNRDIYLDWYSNLADAEKAVRDARRA